MLYNFQTFLHKKDRLKGVHFGTVVDNDDPNRLGHVKVRVPEVLDGSTEDLPWIAPKYTSFLGGNTNAQNFVVPNEGAEVCIEFQNPYCIYYTGWTPSNRTRNDELTEESRYTDIYGARDEQDTGWFIDREMQSVEVRHVSGTVLKCDADGSVTLINPGNFSMQIGGDFDVTAMGNITIQSGEFLKILALKALETISGGSSIFNSGGNFNVKTAGDNSMVAAGDTSISTGKSSGTGNLNLSARNEFTIRSERNALITALANFLLDVTGTSRIESDAASTIVASKLTVDANTEFDNGHSVKHGTKNIGKDHTHSGVQSGGSTSGPPV